MSKAGHISETLDLVQRGAECAWKRNPHGMWFDFNPRVSCEQYVPE